MWDQGCQNVAQRPVSACCLFFFTKNGRLNGLKNIKRRIFHVMWNLCENQISMTINKVYYSTAMPICLCIICGCICAKMVELGSCDRAYSSLQDLTYLLCGLWWQQQIIVSRLAIIPNPWQPWQFSLGPLQVPTVEVHWEATIISECVSDWCKVPQLTCDSCWSSVFKACTLLCRRHLED